MNVAAAKINSFQYVHHQSQYFNYNRPLNALLCIYFDTQSSLALRVARSAIRSN
jgi:hypothetical protein